MGEATALGVAALFKGGTFDDGRRTGNSEVIEPWS